MFWIAVDSPLASNQPDISDHTKFGRVTASTLLQRCAIAFCLEVVQVEEVFLHPGRGGNAAFQTNQEAEFNGVWTLLTFRGGVSGTFHMSFLLFCPQPDHFSKRIRSSCNAPDMDMSPDVSFVSLLSSIRYTVDHDRRAYN